MDTKKSVEDLIDRAIMLIEQDPTFSLDNSEILDAGIPEEDISESIKILEQRLVLMELKSHLGTVRYGLNNLKKYL